MYYLKINRGVIFMSEYNKEPVIIKPDTDITEKTVNDLRDKILFELGNNRVNIIIDLTNVTMIDSIGLGIIISCYKALQEFNGTLTITSASEDIMQLFTVLKLDKHLSISSDV
jgi:anti-anti-sigma factor